MSAHQHSASVSSPILDALRKTDEWIEAVVCGLHRLTEEGIAGVKGTAGR